MMIVGKCEQAYVWTPLGIPLSLDFSRLIVMTEQQTVSNIVETDADSCHSQMQLWLSQPYPVF